MKRTILIFLVGLLVGGLAGRQRRGPQEAPPASPSRPAPGATVRKWSPADFHELVREAGVAADASRVNPLRYELAEWTAEELRLALDEALASPQAGVEFGKSQLLMGYLLDEWMRRDLPAVLAWFEAIKSQSTRGGLSGQLAFWWPKDRAEEGLAYVAANARIFTGNGGTSSWPITEAALSASARRGTAAFAGVLAILREHGLYFPNTKLEFAEDFDFAAIMKNGVDTELWKSGKASCFLAPWLSRDRDAAFEAIVAKHREMGGDLGPYLFSVELPATAAELSDHVNWMSGKIGAMNGDEQRQLVAQGAKIWSGHPDALKAFAASLADPAARQVVHEQGVKAIHVAGVQNALHHLEALGDAEARLTFLEAMDADRPFFSQRGGFPESEQSLLREKLVEWQAAPERIDAIVNRLKQTAP